MRQLFEKPLLQRKIKFPRFSRNMATARTIQLRSSQKADYFRKGMTETSSALVSSLLQYNHDHHHVFFNDAGFHNHIAHHLLTLWALGASPRDLQRGFDTNRTYQRPTRKAGSTIVNALYDAEKFLSYCGTNSYDEFLEFFHCEIETKSWQAVVHEYLLVGDERADSMLARLFDGILHPWIHLGFGVEFEQPAIIAEALAQTACHNSGLASLLVPAEQAAKVQDGEQTIVAVLEEARRNGPAALSRFRLTPENLEQRSAEAMNTIAYYTAGLARRSGMHFKFDFYLIHSVNSSIFCSTFLRQDWLSTDCKSRLIEWKFRLDIDILARRNLPSIELVRNYAPNKPSGWDGVEGRTCALKEDGHLSKFIRALALGTQISEPYKNNDAFILKSGDWLQIAHMAVDSAEAFGDSWAR